MIVRAKDCAMVKPMVALAFAAPIVFAAPRQVSDPQLTAVFAQLGITSEQQAAIDKGRPVAKDLSWGTSSEVFVFGAVHITGSPGAYLKMARNVPALSGTPGYLGVGEIPENATSANLAGLSLDPDDIKALRKCREGSCDVQLPTSSIQAFQDAVNWSQPDPAGQVNALARGMVLDLVREYRRGGNVALGVYRDKEHPALVAQQFETMVSRSATLPEVIPELRQYLLNYPGADLPGADSFFFWENVDFGLKPTIRVNHGVIYEAGNPKGSISAVAIKQLYASHYFHTALDVNVCVVDTARPAPPGFYLLTLKSSEQDGLTGMKGSILRKVVVSKTRSSLEKALAAIKDTIEHASTSGR
jgi:hypothetical protein